MKHLDHHHLSPLHAVRYTTLRWGDNAGGGRGTQRVDNRAWFSNNKTRTSHYVKWTGACRPVGMHFINRGLSNARFLHYWRYPITIYMFSLDVPCRFSFKIVSDL